MRRVYFNEYNILMDGCAYLPIVSGLLQAYAQTKPQLVEAYTFMPYLFHRDSVDVLVEQHHDPDVVAFSMSMWNEQLSLRVAEAVKGRYPACLVVVGGPQVPHDPTAYFARYPFLDVAARSEGEESFAEILDRHLSGSTFDGIAGISWRQPDTGRCVVNREERPQSKDLDVYPSPYLEGLYESLFEAYPDLTFQAIIETNRGCPFPCFAGDTYVALPDRIIRFDEQQYTAKTPCGMPGHSHTRCLDEPRIVAQGEKPCLTLHFDNGLSLTATPGHQIQGAQDGRLVWRTIQSLSVGDWVVCQVGQNAVEDEVVLNPPVMDYPPGIGHRRPESIQFPGTLNGDLAWLLGFIIGDGCLPSDRRAALHLALTPDTEGQARERVRRVCGLEIKDLRASNTAKMRHGWIYSRMFVRYLTETCGIDPTEKHRAPRPVFSSPARIVRAFLRGLWAADGYAPKKRSGQTYLTTVSHTLAEEVAMLIHWIGDAAVVRSVVQRGRGDRPVYRVEWHDETCRSRSTGGRPCVASRVPFPSYVRRDRSGSYRISKRNGRAAVLRSTLEKGNPDHPLVDKTLVYARVVSVIDVGIRPVYDVSNPPVHTVGANGVLAKNCSFCFWGQGGLSMKYRYHSLDRTRQEIEWCARHKIVYMFNADSNFGMNRRDRDIAQMLVDTKATYGYPEKFRTCFGKNTDDKIYAIAKLLHDHGLEKGITLARQSNDPQTLENVRRQNIKMSTYQSLQEQFNRADIPVYSELILGLPGETYETWMAGIDEILTSGLKNQLFVYFCQIYPNTEMDHPEYREKFGIETQHLFLTELHGSIRQHELPPEYEEIIVKTDSMTTDDWRKMAIYAWTTMVLHSLKLAYYPLLYLVDHYPVSYGQLIRAFAEGQFPPNLGSIWRTELQHFHTQLDQLLNGKGRGQYLPDYGDIYWDEEEASFLRISERLDQFYRELVPVLESLLTAWDVGPVDRTRLSEVVQYQQALVPLPTIAHRQTLCAFSANVPKYFETFFQTARVPLIPDHPQWLVAIPMDYHGVKEHYARSVIVRGRKSGSLLNEAEYRDA